MSDLAEELEALTQFLYYAPVGLMQLASDGRIIMINPLSAQLLMPLQRDGSLDNLFVALEGIAPDLRILVEGFDAPSGIICDAILLPVLAGVPGRSDPKVLSLSVVKLDAQRLMAVLTDVSRQVKRERLLQQNEAWLNAIATSIVDYAWVSLDEHGRVSAWNESIGRLAGHGRSVVGQSYAVFSPDGAITPEGLLDRLREADRDGWSVDEGWRVRADGSRFWGSALIAPLRVRNGAPLDERLRQGDPTCSESEYDALNRIGDASAGTEHAYCLVIRDISDRREASELRRRTHDCDHLTGLANRRVFYESAALEFDRWRRAPRALSLILLDVDHFKRINDRHGHSAGDVVLRQLATTIAAAFRGLDVVARIGGEEFAVLLPSTDLHTAHAVAERLRRTVAAAPVEVDGVSIACTVSGGVATMSHQLAGLDDLMKKADVALYAAKAAGRNRIEAALPV